MTGDVLRDQALAYASRGWRMLPVHSLLPDGRCSCRHLNCKTPAKHPYESAWQLRATTSGADIWEWWERWPAANLGIATGYESGIWAADIDPEHDGDATLAALVDEHGQLPATRTHRTGSGGTHYLFAYPDFEVISAAGTLGQGIDTRGALGMIVAPPSVSAKGAYTVVDDRDPVPAPDWMLELLRPRAAGVGGGKDTPAVSGEPVEHGTVPPRLAELLSVVLADGQGRHRHFFRIVAEARRAGYTQGQAVTLAAPWCALVGKFTGRVDKQVATVWGKLAAEEEALRLPLPTAAADDLVASAARPERAEVQGGSRNPVDIADDVAIHVIAGNDPPSLFSMGASAVLLRDGKLEPLDADGWLYYVARRVNFQVSAKGGDTRTVQPPAGAMKLVPSVVIPELPELDGIASTPYIDAAGRVVADDGYHPATRLVLHTGGLQLAPVGETPGAEDVAQAVKLLTEDWLGDFPFASNADRANALAVLLTLTGRAFFSLAPLFVIDASTPGSGKGLLVATISLIAGGEAPHLMELPSDGEEQRKKITSALLAGQQLITWDESHVIAGRSLAMILTAEKYSDRLLGGNKMISVVNSFTQVALGNNVQVWGDMKRRVVPSRLEPDTGHPEHRTGFRHPDLEGWVRGHRGELLGAVLTIWRNWAARGRPKADVTMGSFDRWARTIGGALQAAGIDGFLSSTGQWLDTSDEDTSEWQEHLAALRRTFAGNPFTANDVADRIVAGDRQLDPPWFKRDADMPLSKALGYRYRTVRDRWLGAHRLVSPGMSNGRTRWRIEIRDAGNVSTDLTISTENYAKPDAPGRDGEISRDQSGASEFRFQQPDPWEWPEDSAGAEANRGE